MSTEVLAALAAVLRTLGDEAVSNFAVEPLVVHDARFFPDRWSEDMRGVSVAIRRVLALAGLQDVAVELIDHRESARFREADDNIVLATVEQGTASFVVQGLNTPMLLVPQICLEVGRLALALRGPAPSPYREGDDLPDLPDDAQATLASIALGFGVITLQGSAQVLKSEEVRGGLVEGRSVLSTVGGLSPAECAEALAAQLCLRGEDPSSVRAFLGPDHQPRLRDAFARVEESSEELLESLGLPAKNTWPDASGRFVGDLPVDTEHEAALVTLDAEFREFVARPNAGNIAFAVTSKSTWRGLVAGITLGIVCAVVTGQSAWLALAVLGLVAGRLTTRRLCSECMGALKAAHEICPACGASIVGAIGHRRERLAAAEAFEAAAIDASPSS